MRYLAETSGGPDGEQLPPARRPFMRKGGKRPPEKRTFSGAFCGAQFVFGPRGPGEEDDPRHLPGAPPGRLAYLTPEQRERVIRAGGLILYEPEASDSDSDSGGSMGEAPGAATGAQPPQQPPLYRPEAESRGEPVYGEELPRGLQEMREEAAKVRDALRELRVAAAGDSEEDEDEERLRFPALEQAEEEEAIRRRRRSQLPHPAPTRSATLYAAAVSRAAKARKDGGDSRSSWMSARFTRPATAPRGVFYATAPRFPWSNAS